MLLLQDVCWGFFLKGGEIKLYSLHEVTLGV